MGDLYNELKFVRKGSFFKRVAAMHSVNPTLPNPEWKNCYSLLVQSFPGFKMSFNPDEFGVSGKLKVTAVRSQHFTRFNPQR